MGIKDIIAVDDHSNLELKENIAHCEIQDYIDIEEFLDQVISNQLDNKGVRAVFHQGCLLYTSPSPRDKRQSRIPGCG